MPDQPSAPILVPGLNPDPPMDRQLRAELSNWRPATELGVTGINRTGGSRAIVDSDWLPQLRSGRSAVEAFRELVTNDPIAFAGYSAIDLLVRNVPWRVEPASDKAKHREQAEFVEDCMNDMATSWPTVVSEAMTMLPYGVSVLEMVLKRRQGENERNPTQSSKFDDGKWGWGKFSPRAPWTFLYWIYDEDGEVVGVRQMSPPKWNEVVIPLAKCIYCRPRGNFDNPWGASIFRGAYVPYFFLRKMREIEGIGVERDLAGLPVALVPAEILGDGATPEQITTRAAIEALVRNVRRDQQEGVLFPLVYDDNGNKMFEFQLMTSGGSRALPIHDIITRYEQRIATSILADFLMLGQGEGSGGSYALSSDKSSLFKTAIETYLDVLRDELQRKAVTRLGRLNGWDLAELPQLQPGQVGKRDLAMLGGFLQQMAATGLPLWPNPELADHIFQIADLPEPTDEVKDQLAFTQQAQTFQSLGLGPDGEPLEDPMAQQPGGGGDQFGGGQEESAGDGEEAQAEKDGAKPKRQAEVKLKVEVPEQAKPKRPA